MAIKEMDEMSRLFKKYSMLVWNHSKNILKEMNTESDAIPGGLTSLQLQPLVVLINKQFKNFTWGEWNK